MTTLARRSVIRNSLVVDAAGTAARPFIAHAEVNAQQVWGAAEADIIRNGLTPQAAAEAAFKKIETIVAKYPIVQS